MKNPLQYQRSEYDCGPTSVLNALSFLFHREEIPPQVLKYIMLYCLDAYNSKGDHGRSGTSHMAMLFLSNWLNQFGRAKKFPIQAEYLSGDQVSAAPNSRVVSALQQGGAAVARVMYGGWHYVLLTGCEGDRISLWDPYYRVRPFASAEVELLTDTPTLRNRRLPAAMLDNTGRQTYAMGDLAGREAVLFFNRNTRRTQESSIEYFI